MRRLFAAFRVARFCARALVVLMMVSASSVALAVGMCAGDDVPQTEYHVNGYDLPWRSSMAAALGDLFASRNDGQSVNSCDANGYCSVNGFVNGDRGRPVTYSDQFYFASQQSCPPPPPPPPRCSPEAPPPVCSVGSDPACYASVVAASPPSSSCRDGCEYRNTDSIGVRFGDAGSYNYSSKLGSGTGRSCGEGSSPPAAGEPPLPQPPPTPPDVRRCPSGQALGTVNGVESCYDIGQADSRKDYPPTTKQNSDGSNEQQNKTERCSGSSCTTTTTTTTTQANGSSSQTTTTTTINSSSGAGSSSSTTTTKDAAGNPSSPPSTSSSNGTAESACKADPKAKGCAGAGGGSGGKGDGTGGFAAFGDCATPPVCDGDAVQCAIALEVHRGRCAEQKRFDVLLEKPPLTLGQQLLAGNDPLAATLPGPTHGTTVAAGTLDKSGFLGGGGGMSNRTITGPLGLTFVMDMSALNNNLVAIRGAVMIVASMACFAIVRRSIGG